jgi:alpha-mannosidase
LHTGTATVRAVLDLMDEFPALTFTRGEAAIYDHLERHEPELFARMRRRVVEGRWEVVGGTWIQPDTNLPATETFARHLAVGQRYFRSRFGRPVRVAWAADSFGHSAGLPTILAAAGITGFAFTRPAAAQFPLRRPAFWWEGPDGARLLAYRPPHGAYLCEREGIGQRLDAVLAAAQADELANVACFFGLGNHGGGPTRRHLREIAAWTAAHPEARVVYSGLHRLFDALRAELRGQPRDFLPRHRGELNGCLRGCYASAARFKSAYRQTEASVVRAEAGATAIAAALRLPPPALSAAWRAVLINSFHDILPGSSIERAYDDQFASLGLARQQAQEAEFAALTALARRVDTRVPPPPRPDDPAATPFLVWNPHPHPWSGHVELECCLDARPLPAYAGDRVAEVPLEVRGATGRALPFQEIPTEHNAWRRLPWRKRVVVPVSLPPLGWQVVTLGWVEGARRPAVTDGASAGAGAIRCGDWRVAVEARGAAVVVRRGGRVLTRLHFETVEDPWGSWGGMGEEPASLDLRAVRHLWRVVRQELLERGPERAVLGVQLEGGHSRVTLRCALYRGREAVEVAARIFWNERSARLKLVCSGAGREATFEVPGGTIKRQAGGEVPGGRWVRTAGFGIASDCVYGYNLRRAGVLDLTLARATRYADDAAAQPAEAPWLPVVDCGELKARFLVTAPDALLPQLADEWHAPPLAQSVAASPGALARQGSFLEVRPGNLRVLALKPAEDGKGVMLRLQETAGKRTVPRLVWLGHTRSLEALQPHGLATWRLHAGRTRAVTVDERPGVR